MDTSEWTDAREFPRSKGAWPVVIMTNRGALIAETRNISPQGAFIFCDRPPPPEAKIRVIIMFPNSRYLDLAAEVTWSYPYGSDKTIPRMEWASNLPRFLKRIENSFPPYHQATSDQWTGKAPSKSSFPSLYLATYHYPNFLKPGYFMNCRLSPSPCRPLVFSA